VGRDAISICNEPNTSQDHIAGSPNNGPRSHFVNDEKMIYSTYEKFVDLVEYNIFRNDHIA